MSGRCQVGYTCTEMFRGGKKNKLQATQIPNFLGFCIGDNCPAW